MTNYTYKIANLERETATGKVYAVHYTIDAVNETYSAGAYGSVGLDGELATPYGQLTEAECIQWVKDALGAEKIAEVEAALQAQLDEQAAPSKAAGVPW